MRGIKCFGSASMPLSSSYCSVSGLLSHLFVASALTFSMCSTCPQPAFAEEAEPETIEDTQENQETTETVEASTVGLSTSIDTLLSDGSPSDPIDTAEGEPSSQFQEVEADDPENGGAGTDDTNGAGANQDNGSSASSDATTSADEVVPTADETDLRAFDPQARYVAVYAGLGFCGGAVLGSVFTRGWGKWGNAPVSAHD